MKAWEHRERKENASRWIPTTVVVGSCRNIFVVASSTGGRKGQKGTRNDYGSFLLSGLYIFSYVLLSLICFLAEGSFAKNMNY